MGVIKRFAVSSIVLGTLAIAGGASALAFEGESGGPASPPAGSPALESDVPADSAVDNSDVSDVSDVSDGPAEELPETGGPDPAWGWLAPHSR